MEVVLYLVALFLIDMTSCTEVPKYKLNDGREMPAIALGTYLGFGQNGTIKPQNKEVRDVITKAIDLGWRHIDTAAIYDTEEEIGEGVGIKIEDGTVKRDDLFITTKLWNTHHKREQVAEALRESLKKLHLDYVDLYLIHWPISLNPNNTLSNVDFMETWRGMEDVQKLGLAKSIGVSNFNKNQLERILNEGSVKPAALQIEIHLQISQQDLVAYAQDNGIVVMGYSPFGSLVSKFGMMFPGPRVDDASLVAIADKYGKTVPQTVLRWMIERKIVPLPKTLNPKRLEENLNVFDFAFDKNDMEVFNSYNKGIRYTLPSFWQDHPHYPFDKIDEPVPDPFLKKE